MPNVWIEPRPRKNGKKYRVLYRDPLTGKKEYFQTYRLKGDAREAVYQLETVIRGGESHKIAKLKEKRRPLSFSRIAQELEKDWEKKLAAGQLRPKSVEDYSRFLRMVNEQFGDKLALLITESEIDDYRYEVAKRLSNVSSNKRLFIVKQVFQKGMRLKAIPENPASGLGYLSEKMHERNRYLQPDEIVKLVRCALKTRAKKYLPAIILLGADYGASIQEVMDLSWQEIDFKRKTIRFYRTKNQRERTMAMLGRSADALLDWWDHLTWMRHRKRITRYKVDKVFCHLNGEPIKEIRSSWKEACRLANIHDFRIHDLRHTYGTNLLESGADLGDVMEMLGHRSLRMARRYAHVTNKKKKALQVGLEKHYQENGG
jgi:integrase